MGNPGGHHESAGLETVLGRLKGVRKSGTGWVALCPAHDDKKPSLSIGIGSTGKLLLHCHAGCSFESIMNALGLASQAPAASSDRSGLPPDGKVWIYRDRTGDDVLAVWRRDEPDGSKTIRQFRRENGRWVAGGLKDNRPCLHLPMIMMAPPETIIWVVEGEKCVDAIIGIGALATTSPGGAKAAAKADWSWARGRKIGIIPDNDEPGYDYAEEVAQLCVDAGAAEVRIADLSKHCTIPEHGDIADVLVTPELLEALWQTARVMRSAEERKEKAARDNRLRLNDAMLADAWLSDNPHMVFSLQRWYRFDGRAWIELDRADVHASILATIRPICEGADLSVSATRIQSVRQIAEAMAHRGPQWWEHAPEVISLQNCAIDIATGRPVQHSPDHRVMVCLPYGFDPNAQCPLWERILEENVGDAETIRLLRQFAGYCLTRDTKHEVAIWLYGPPGCGKSTVIAGFEVLLGGLVAPLGLWDIERSGFTLTQLIGRHLVIATEQPSEYLRCTHILNAIISGESIVVEQKYRDAVSFRPFAKVLWACNELPRVSDVQAGLFRRVRVVPCRNRVAEPDPTLKEQLRTEAAGILNWALEGLKDLRANGRFVESSAVRAAVEDYQRSCDIAGLFLEEETEPCDVTTLSASQLYSAYADWCQRNGHRPKSSTAVAHDWVRLGLQRIRGRSGTFYAGRKLRNRTADML